MTLSSVVFIILVAAFILFGLLALVALSLAYLYYRHDRAGTAPAGGPPGVRE